jgi:hypothetical protein
MFPDAVIVKDRTTSICAISGAIALNGRRLNSTKTVALLSDPVARAAHPRHERTASSGLRPVIYLIGGAPRSGKTSLALELLRAYNVSFVSTDALLNFEGDFEMGLMGLIDHVANALPGYAIEGEAVTPPLVIRAARIARIRSCFLGRPEVTLEQLLDVPGSNAWIVECDQEERRSVVEGMRERSRHLKSECRALGLPFLEGGDEGFFGATAEWLAVGEQGWATS